MKVSDILDRYLALEEMSNHSSSSKKDMQDFLDTEVIIPSTAKVIPIFAIRNIKTGKILTFEVSSNEGGDFCGDIQYILGEDDSYPTYTLKSAEHCFWVIHNSTPWYNADYDTPTHYIKNPKDYEVIELNSDCAVNVKIPTALDFIKCCNDKNLDMYIKEYLKHAEKNKIRVEEDYVIDYYRFKGWLDAKDQVL